jgi:hypothetical protein
MTELFPRRGLVHVEEIQKSFVLVSRHRQDGICSSSVTCLPEGSMLLHRCVLGDYDRQ